MDRSKVKNIPEILREASVLKALAFLRFEINEYDEHSRYINYHRDGKDYIVFNNIETERYCALNERGEVVTGGMILIDNKAIDHSNAYEVAKELEEFANTKFKAIDSPLEFIKHQDVLKALFKARKKKGKLPDPKKPDAFQIQLPGAIEYTTAVSSSNTPKNLIFFKESTAKSWFNINSHHVYIKPAFGC
ncbi:MAG: hypothetical protein RJQ14_02220 [Marinoscillum sp.]